MNKFKIENLNIKRFCIIIIALFLAIVAGLTVSSKFLNDKAAESAMAGSEREASTKAILQTEDETFEEQLSSKNIDYVKIDSDTYIVNYESSEKANEAIYSTYKDSDTVTANYDTVFETAGIFDRFGISKVQASALDVKPDGMTWREYADSVGKKLVAVIDTGVSSEYASENINFTDEVDEDENGHGTSVAKTIMANADGKAIVLSLKAMGKDGTGYMSDIMEAVQYAREQQVDIINMSIAAPDNSGTVVFKQLIANAINDGIQVVASAGNYSSSAMVYIPANIDGVISVGAMDENNKKIDSSNYAASYYEKADSTSQAAAILTGKLASGKSLDEETKEDDVVIDKEAIDASFLTTGFQTVVEDGNKTTSDLPFVLHVSIDVQQKIFEHETHKYIISATDINDFVVNGDAYEDNTFGSYIYAFNNLDDFEESWKNIENIEYSPEIMICSDEIKETEFKVQVKASSDSGTLNGRWNLHLEAEGKDAHVWATATIQSVSGSKMLCGASYNLVIDGTTVASKDLLSGYWFTEGTQWSGDKAVTKTNVGVSAYVHGNASSYSGGNFTGSTSLTINSGYVENVTYKVTYQANGGSISKTSDSKTVKPGESYTVTLPSATRTYYNCSGWYEGSNRVGGPGETVTLSGSNHTLTAQWTAKSFSFIIDPNGGSLFGSTAAQQIGTVTCLSNAYYDNRGRIPTRTGYTFAGYYDSASGGTMVFNSSGLSVTSKYFNSSNQYIYEGNLKVYAHWTENTYSIKYVANDNGVQQTTTTATGSTASQNNLKYTQTVTIQNNGFSKTGYHFLYWSTNSNGTGTHYSPGQRLNSGSSKTEALSATNGATVTLYAIWTPNTYTIVYNANADKNVRYNSKTNKDEKKNYSSDVEQYAATGAVPSKTSHTYDAYKNLNTNSNFTWAGHTFLGWSTDKNATSATYTNGQSIRNLTATDGGTVNLYAVWKANSYTLTVDPNGGGTWNGSSATQKGNADTIQDGKGNTKWGDVVTLGDAKAEDKSATITYDKNADDATLDRTSDTVKWVFSRWTTTGKSTYLHNNSARDNNGNHDNGAATYYVIHDTNDTVKAQYYFQTIFLPTPTREGYTFLGWYEDAALTKKANRGGNGNGGSLYRTTQNITLYARWQKNAYDYADTEQVFMQDKTVDPSVETPKTYLRKIDINTNSPLTSYDDESFVIGVYKNSVSNSNLVLKLDTAKGIYNANGTLVIGSGSADSDGWYDITAYLTKGTTYVVHEISAPAGWSIAADKNYTYTGSGRLQMEVKDGRPYIPNVEDYFVKLDANGRAVAGATFNLIDKTNNNKVVWTGTTNENGKFNYEYDSYTEDYDKTFYSYCTAGHTYILREVSSPDGYKTGSDITFTVPATGVFDVNNIVYEEPTSTVNKLQIIKKDSTGEKLEGAVFQLFMKDANGELTPCYMDKNGKWTNATEASDNASLMIATTDASGTATFEGLPLRASYTGSEEDFTKSYYLKEIQAPEGYSLLTDIVEIRIPEDKAGGTATYEVMDDSVTLTLEAGGNGINIAYFFSGAGMIALAVVLVALNRRKHA